MNNQDGMSVDYIVHEIGLLEEVFMQIGDKISFGKYEWRVLDIKTHSALMITEDIVELRAYHNKPGDITWADCELRTYLNSDFYDIFTEEEQQKIIPTTIVNNDNPWFDTIGGKDTTDKIFLLSIEEVVCLYFGDSSENLKVPSGKYKYWFTRKDVNNEKRKATYLGYIWWWWLRSPGRKQVKAAYIHGDGNIGIQGNSALKCNLSGVYHPVNHDVRGGVRPALWMKL